MNTMTKTWLNDVGTMNVRIWGMATMAMTMTLAACGNDGGTSASGGATDGGTSTGASTGSASASVAEGSNSMSDSASEATAGSNSDSQASMTTPTGSDSLSDSATVSASASATDSTVGTTGAMTGTGDTDTAGTTVGIDTSSTSGTSSTSSGSTTGGEPLVCGSPPKGFAGPEDPTCKNAPSIGSFNPVVEWKKASWLSEPSLRQIMMTPLVVSLTDDNMDGKIDGNDKPDLVVTTYNQQNFGQAAIRGLSGDGQTDIFSVTGQGIHGLSGLAAGDIDGDGVVEIIGLASGGVVKAFEHDGTLKWTSPSVESHCARFSQSMPTIADLDGDGKPEVLVGRAILNNNGTLRGAGAHGTGAYNVGIGSLSIAADLDGDNIQELVVGNAAYNANGGTIWNNQQSDGYTGVADFDKNGTPEIVVVYSGNVRLQTATGNVLWSVAHPGGIFGGPPTIADFDGDGLPEIGVGGTTLYTVFDGDGKVMWSQPVADKSGSVNGSSVYDFEGDGVAEIVYSDETDLYVFAGNNGAVKLKYADHNSGTLTEFPLVVDVDGDGEAEIVVSHNQFYPGDLVSGLTVIGDKDNSWRPGRKIWNQHAYSITNVNDDGTIPPTPDPNWKTYNNFRSGDISPPDGLKASDLTLDAVAPCEFECKDGKLVVWVHLGNEGASPATAGATIKLVGLNGGQVKTMQSVEFKDALDPGVYTDAFAFELDPGELETIELTVTANEQECDETNNKVVIQGPFCEI